MFSLGYAFPNPFPLSASSQASHGTTRLRTQTLNTTKCWVKKMHLGPNNNLCKWSLPMLPFLFKRGSMELLLLSLLAYCINNSYPVCFIEAVIQSQQTYRKPFFHQCSSRVDFLKSIQLSKWQIFHFCREKLLIPWTVLNWLLTHSFSAELKICTRQRRRCLLQQICRINKDNKSASVETYNAVRQSSIKCFDVTLS